jgi:hypothetical protein
MDAWIECEIVSPYLCSYANIVKAYERLPASSPMVKCMVDMYAWFSLDMWIGRSMGARDKDLAAMPKEFLYDMMIKLFQEKQPYWDLDAMGSKFVPPYCRYHEHNGEKCGDTSEN